MPSTLKHAISYPSGSQAPNVPIVMQTAAESVDAAVDKIVTGTVAKSAVVTYAANVSAYAAGVHPTVTRQGIMVVLSGRVNRTVASSNLLTIPSGYRPDKTFFVVGLLNANAVMFQFNTDGTVTMPFSTGTGDIMVQASFTCPVTPAAP